MTALFEHFAYEPARAEALKLQPRQSIDQYDEQHILDVGAWGIAQINDEARWRLFSPTSQQLIITMTAACRTTLQQTMRVSDTITAQNFDQLPELCAEEEQRKSIVMGLETVLYDRAFLKPLLEDHVSYMAAFTHLVELKLLADNGDDLAVAAEFTTVHAQINRTTFSQIFEEADWKNSIGAQLIEESEDWKKYEALSSVDREKESEQVNVKAHIAVKALANKLHEREEDIQAFFIINRDRNALMHSEIKHKLIAEEMESVKKLLYRHYRFVVRFIMESEKRARHLRGLTFLINRWYTSAFDSEGRLLRIDKWDRKRKVMDEDIRTIRHKKKLLADHRQVQKEEKARVPPSGKAHQEPVKRTPWAGKPTNATKDKGYKSLSLVIESKDEAMLDLAHAALQAREEARRRVGAAWRPAFLEEINSIREAMKDGSNVAAILASTDVQRQSELADQSSDPKAMHTQIAAGLLGTDENEPFKPTRVGSDELRDYGKGYEAEEDGGDVEWKAWLQGK